jgi:hypothetical protein
LDVQATAFVYIYARISQIAEMTLSFYATIVERRESGDCGL